MSGDVLGSGKIGESPDVRLEDLSAIDAEVIGSCEDGSVTTTEVSVSRDSTLLRPGGSEGTSCCEGVRSLIPLNSGSGDRGESGDLSPREPRSMSTAW